MTKTNQRATILFEDGTNNWGVSIVGELTERQKKTAFDKCIMRHGLLLPYTITRQYELL